MSFTNKTTHYEIPLPTQTDLVNGLDWNTSSEAIDTAIYNAAQAASTAASDITTIQGDIVNLQAKDTEIEGNVTALTGRVSTLEQNTENLEEDVQDVADMITAYEEATATASRAYTVGDPFRYNGVLYICTVDIAEGGTIVPNTNCRATNVMTELGDITTPEADEVAYDNTDSGLTATNVQGAIDEIEGNLSVELVSASSTAFSCSANTYQSFEFAIDNIPQGYSPVAFSYFNSGCACTFANIAINRSTSKVSGVLYNSTSNTESATVSVNLFCVKTSNIVVHS